MLLFLFSRSTIAFFISMSCDGGQINTKLLRSAHELGRGGLLDSACGSVCTEWVVVEIGEAAGAVEDDVRDGQARGVRRGLLRRTVAVVGYLEFPVSHAVRRSDHPFLPLTGYTHLATDLTVASRLHERIVGVVRDGLSTEPE